ncbi:MAG TPA: uridine diphosphate-N-acetylglucosamine-binding protein YvcK [Acidimicrobiales bacterium]|nr:uridine diphosphate-N-acetylglucosamine-binding protein YvcK [Acidimicrobiales bacterium]
MSAVRVVALGGGHGLAATLQAVRRYASDITAIVSVADDGGSSGRLREALGISAPGDIRRCLVALSEPESVWAKAFEHRFEAGELQGHAVGNLVIAGLAAATGDFTSALAEAGRAIGAVGRVLPATTAPVVLKAEAAGGEVQGQVNVAQSGRISRVGLVPPDPRPPDEALEAIAEADQVVLGPGSLFTSILAAVVVPGIRDALQATPARKVYVCNLRPQVPETAGYDVAAHVEALTAHGVEVDVVVCDPTELAVGAMRTPCIERLLARRDGPGHDPAALAAALSELAGLPTDLVG